MKIGMTPETAAAAVASDKATAAKAGSGGKAVGSAAPVASTKNAPEASAQLELSTEATNLLAGVADDGTFDAEKVGRISQAIQEGKFTVNAEAIAEKLVANAAELIDRSKPQH
jgi:negative regulator of flagellin synthesis FlgM